MCLPGRSWTPGKGTRIAAIFLAVTMAVAFYKGHGGVLIAPPDAAPDFRTGEMAFIYLAGFVTIFLAGAGRFSLDAKVLK